jgi:hypothetical protein
MGDASRPRVGKVSWGLCMLHSRTNDTLSRAGDVSMKELGIPWIEIWDDATLAPVAERALTWLLLEEP